VTEIKAVIFDIGNVLVEWQPERFYDAVIGVERRKQMFETVDLHGMNDEVDSGGPFQETIYNWAEKYPEFRSEIRMWHDRWIEMAAPLIDLSWASLHALQAKGIPVFALSNFGIGSFAYAESEYPELRAFDQRYISGHMGVIKPASQIYQMLEEECGLPAESLLFTDDRKENIDAAANRGWYTHLFEGPEGWVDCLTTHGLLERSEIKG
jgi:2-haloacid dehalogenase